MKIKVLPCIISFINGIGCDQLIGFEGVAEADEFPTSALEERLAQSGLAPFIFNNVGVIDVEKTKINIFKFAPKTDESDDD